MKEYDKIKIDGKRVVRKKRKEKKLKIIYEAY